VVTVVSRLTTGLREGWADAAVALPAGTWRDVLTGRTYDGEPLLADLLADLPVALLTRQQA
jgi:(1->4)-alpha-D-glucan 1-alpha-D-glucosylmutase